jgi:hypothetical protein
LYQIKKLDLPGIGSFTLDPGAVIPQETDRVGQVHATGITFKNANIPLADDNLITFIRDHTGKMKSLAAADLDFYLTTGRQLLNIGKPFYLEGIGTLVKNKEGLLEFTPGDYLVARLEEPGRHDRRGATSHEDQLREESKPSNSRQTLLLVGLIAGLIVIGWGGYYLYKRNNYVEPTTENRATVVPDTTAARRPDTTTTTHPITDTGTVRRTAATVSPPKSDSTKTAAATPPAATPAGPSPASPTPTLTDPIPSAGQILYRFVILQTPNKGHALRRYNQLLGYQLNIRLYQKDSSWFKLYFPIAATIRDTTHIRDSLADVYAAHVTVEH